MYSVTSGFLSAINDTDRDIDVYVVLDGVTYTADSIVSMRYQHGVLTDRYEVGQVPAAYVEIVLKDVSTSTVIDNKSLTPYIGVNVSGAYEYVPLGVFTVDASERNMSQITIHAMDRMVKLESAYTSSLTYPAQLSAVLAEVLSGYTSSITLPSYLSSYTVNKLDGLTKRQVLSYIASISGANAYVDRTGVFKFKNYPTSPSTSPLQSINGDTYFKFTHEDVTYGINQVVLTDGTSSWTASNVPSGNTSFSLNVYSEYAKSTIATDIKNMLAGTPLLTYQLDFVGNPALELGDNIKIVEYIDDETTNDFYVNIGQIDITFDGRINSTLSGVGESKQSNIYASPGELMSTVNLVKNNSTIALSTANTANTAATVAQTTADGKNTVFYAVSTSAPVAKKTNDVWFVTDQSNKIRYWSGTAWVDALFGTNAISNAAITNALIADATIQSAKIASIDAGKITAGTMVADRIQGGTLKLGGTVYGTLEAYTNTNGRQLIIDATGISFLNSNTVTYFFAPNAATLPTDTTIGSVTSTEIGRLSGVTTNIQTQLNGKASTSSPTLTTPTLSGGFTMKSAGGVTTGSMTDGGTLTANSLKSNALGTGTVYSNAGTLTNTNPSDINLKTDIEPLKYGLQDVLAIQPVSYNWKDQEVYGDKRQLGIIAQEVEKVVPEVVERDENHIGVDYVKLIPVLLNAVKELSQEVTELKKLVNKPSE